MKALHADPVPSELLTQNPRATSSGGRRNRATNRKHIEIINRVQADYNTGDEAKRRPVGGSHTMAPTQLDIKSKKKNIAALMQSQTQLNSAHYHSAQHHGRRQPGAKVDALFSKQMLD